MPLCCAQVRDALLMSLRRFVAGKSDCLTNYLEKMMVSRFPVSHEEGLDSPTITVQRGTDTVEEHLHHCQQTA